MTPEQVIGRVFGVDPATLDDSTPSGGVEGWDSLGHVNLVLELESTYGISLSPDAALRMKSVGSIKEVLQAHGARW